MPAKEIHSPFGTLAGLAGAGLISPAVRQPSTSQPQPNGWAYIRCGLLSATFSPSSRRSRWLGFPADAPLLAFPPRMYGR